MSIIKGAIQDVANNTLAYTHGANPVETLPSPAEQFGHANPIQKQPTWAEIAPKLETAAIKAGGAS